MSNHEEWVYNLGTPRQFTQFGGWNVECECGELLSDTSDPDLDVKYQAHLDSVKEEDNE